MAKGEPVLHLRTGGLTYETATRERLGPEEVLSVELPALQGTAHAGSHGDSKYESSPSIRWLSLRAQPPVLPPCWGGFTNDGGGIV